MIAGDLGGSLMQPTDLTCGKCGKSWKLIKAGAGAVTCPHCKEPLAAAATKRTAEPPVSPNAATTTGPGPAAVPPAPATPPAPDVPVLTGLSPLALAGTADTDDPALQADYDDRFDRHRRPGAHPLAKVVIILLLFFVGLPVAMFIFLLIVCAVIVAAS